MPPRRKARLPSRAASTPPADASEQIASKTATPSKAEITNSALISDAWTDEQETSLLRSVIRWKPVGMHKHFRMIAISENLRNHGYTSPADEHTRPPGIWKKLGELYNLESLDEREDGFGYPSQTDITKEPFVDFDLPDEDYWDITFSRRLASGGTSSPAVLPFQLSGRTTTRTGRHSTVDDSEDPRSSPASAKGQRGGRVGRGNRPSRLAESSRPGQGGRASKGPLEPSGEEEGEDGNEDPMDVDEDAGKTRRSGRKR